MIVPGRDVPFQAFARETWRRVWCDNLIDYAGSVAFSVLLAIFPFLLFAVALAGLVIEPHVIDSLVGYVRRIFLPEAADLVIGHMHDIMEQPRLGLLTLSAAGAVFVASGAVTALMTAFNVAYQVPESRPLWKTRGIAILVTFAAAVLFVLGSVIAFGTDTVASYLGGPLGTVILWLRWPVSGLVMILIVALLYYLLPDVEQRFSCITPGSLFAVVLWLVASVGFSYYVKHFGTYQAVYGALGSVVVVLLWLWISALAVLLGAEINVVLEHLSSKGKEKGQRTMPADAAPQKGAPAFAASPHPNPVR
jgi:membrane protein